MKRETSEITFIESFTDLMDAVDFINEKTSQFPDYEVVECRINSVGGPFRAGVVLMKENFEGVPEDATEDDQKELFGDEQVFVSPRVGD